jgi:hypothetical protein
LKSGESEQGAWSTHLNVATGGLQAEAAGAITFTCRLSEAGIPKAKAIYIPEGKVLEPGSVPGCNGSNNEPLAEPGFLCVYQGFTATPGSLETEWQNAKFFKLLDPSGNSGKAGPIGEEVVYRTTEYKEGLPKTTLKAAADLTAGGSYSVTAE